MPKNAPKPENPYVQDESKIIVKESLSLRWLAVADIPQLLWGKNPKLHSLSELWDSICKFGFIDPPKFDKNLRNRAGGIGALQFGNGRSEAVHWGYMAYKSGEYTGDVPRGIGVNNEGEWFIPVKVGVDAASEAMAADFGIFHNTSTMLGGDFSDGDIWRLFEPKELLEIGKMILSDKEFEPLAMNSDEVDSLLRFVDAINNGELGGDDNKDTGAGGKGKTIVCPHCGEEFTL